MCKMTVAHMVGQVSFNRFISATTENYELNTTHILQTLGKFFTRYRDPRNVNVLYVT